MRTLAALALLAFPSALWAQEWEKGWDAAVARAAKERRPILMVYGMTRARTGQQTEAMLGRSPLEKATKAFVCVRVYMDRGFPAGFPAKIVPLNTVYYGGLAVLAPTADEGESQMEQNVLKQTPENLAAWLDDVAERYGAPWESSPFTAEWRAKQEQKPLLVLFGTERESCAAYRDPALTATLQKLVLLRVGGDCKLYPCPGAPGAVLFDPLARREVVSWSGSKKADEVKALLEKPLAAWSVGVDERRQRYEKENPYVCGYCGYRSGEADSCCGLLMVKPEPPVWEKTFEDAKARAAKDQRVLVYVLLRNAKEFVTVQELFSEPRLAALAGRVVFCAEEAADAGERTKEFGQAGVFVLASRDGKEPPTLQAKSAGLLTSEGVRMAIVPVVRRQVARAARR